ncbi:MAG: helix-turn-helix domain-containing protein [Alphaproteobacteria bacterium]
MVRKKPSRDDIVDAAFGLFADRGWRSTGMADIAEAAGVSLGDLSLHFGLKTQIVTALMERVDREVLSDTGPEDSEESHRDRLFDVMMRRFDAMTPYKAGIERVVKDLPRDPAAALAVAARARRSLAWMLAAAGIDSDGLRGMVRVKALATVWALTMREWFRDDSPDMSRTMAVLDKHLGRLESLELSFRRKAQHNHT